METAPVTRTEHAFVASVSDADVRAFQTDGVVCLRNLIPSDWIETLRAGVAANMDAPSQFGKSYTPEGNPGGFFGDYCNWNRIPEYRDFMTDSGIGRAAAALMQSPSARVFHEHVLVKEPGTREPTPWHHDQPYYCINGRQVVSLWIPLDPVARENVVEFVAGSHRWGKAFVPTKFTGAAYDRTPQEAEPIPDISARRAEFDVKGFAVEPGDAIDFHILTVHGAPGNASSPNQRRALAARFLGEDAVYGERSGEVSPPYPEIRGKLATGDALPADLFPTVWPTA